MKAFRVITGIFLTQQLLKGFTEEETLIHAPTSFPIKWHFDSKFTIGLSCLDKRDAAALAEFFDTGLELIFYSYPKNDT